MASGFGKKRTLKDKANSFFKKVIAATALVGVVGGAGYYQYGTVKEQDIKVQSYKADTKWNSEKRIYEGSRTVITDKGAFKIDASRLHMHSEEDAVAIWRALDSSKTFRIKTYGVHIAGGWHPNILEVREVTPQELKEMAEEKAKMQAQAALLLNKGKPGGATAAPVQPGTIQQPQAVNLSGYVTSITQIVDGYNVQVTVPVEVAGKIVVNTVKPLIPVTPRPPGP